VGVEEDPSSAPEPGVYDRWIRAPIDSLGEWDRAFDAIVCADVLEHLAEPERVLSSVREWIAPGGVLLVSLPNVANAAVRLSLLAGRFAYTEKGILDRTHLRFFTRKSGRNLIEGAGFQVLRVRATPVPAELAIPALGRPPLRGASRGLAAAAARTWPTLFGYQFLYEARPA
jgi:2-polyprenyl-3-methyl-5-hydroxy-6-metoxy-1,4-benzoquinol methylase